MTSLTLEEQKDRLAQRKAKLQKQEALLKVKERKQRLSQKIKIGELAEKADILDLDPPTLLGAFLSIKEMSIDESRISEWFRKGSELLITKEKKIEN